jgi:L-alanine-DL-glutamate epimerase-like enolase superfamily enzyme
VKITRLDTAVYRFPTPEPEADGTLEWDATTAVAVTARAGGLTGLGWTYSTAAAAAVVRDHLGGAVVGQDTADVAGCWEAMRRACRNFGTRGLVMQAISAVDVALWDLKARTLDLPLRELFGQVRSEVPVYGSGGFTTMSDDALAGQVKQWRALGCQAMKIKIGESWGSRIGRDLARVERLRELAPDADLMVDANGGYSRAQARRVGAALDDLGVVWFEEPVSSDDLDGLAQVRAAVNCDVAAGEYAADAYDAASLCRAVDCLQLDATRCGGYTGFARAASLAAAHNLDVSAHCAPALHAPIAAATVNLRHVEYFADHARLEPLLVEHTPVVHEGAMRPNTTVGHGLVLHVDAELRRA